MSTLSTLKAEIADDLSRSDLTTAIAAEITRSIKHFQKENLFFKENEAAQFVTVIGQVYYATSDDADIGNMVTFDAVKCRVSNSDYNLVRLDIDTFETLNDGQVSNGQPTNWIYYNRKIGIYPPPDAVYTISMSGSVKAAAPAADGTTGNVWMVEGFELLRAHTLAQLSRFKTREYDYAAHMDVEAQRQLFDLRARTEKLKATGHTVPIDF